MQINVFNGTNTFFRIMSLIHALPPVPRRGITQAVGRHFDVFKHVDEGRDYHDRGVDPSCSWFVR